MRERNRHHRQEDGHNHGDEDATRQGSLETSTVECCIALVALPTPNLTGEAPALSVLTPDGPCRLHQKTGTLPVRAKKYALPVGRASTDPPQPLLVPACTHLKPSRLHRYDCLACPAMARSVASQAWPFCLPVVLDLQLLAGRLYRCICFCLETLDAALSALWSCAAPASRSGASTAGPVQISASPSTPTYSRPGPNSRGSLVSCMQQLIILVCLHPACAGSRAEARVAAHATEAAGGIHSCLTCLPASMPKQGGFPTPVKTRLPLNVPNTRSAKRAFKRACLRATRFGHTQYRGRTFTSAQVPEDRRQAGLRPCTRKPRPRPEPAGLAVFSWNAGGLGGGVYDEVMTHLSASSVDIVIIQESKSTECMEYTSGPWSCIHSGCKTQKHAGLLVAVHTRVALSSHLRFEHYLKGRLLHVRVPLQTSDHRHMHIIAVYQKTHVVGDAKSSTQRQQMWQALHKCLNRIPARDSIAVVGDFNAPLRCLPPHVGPFVGAELSHPPDDVSDLEVLLQTFRLTALNTWYPTPGGDHTFTFGKARSQIDYIMVRLSEASTLARQVRTLHHFQVGAARKGGAYHSPLQTQLAVSRPCWVYSGRRSGPCIDQEALLHALDHPHDPSNLQKIAMVRQKVATHVAHHTSLEGVQTLHQTLYDACLQVFPAGKATAQQAPPWQQPQVQESIQHLWSKWRAFTVSKSGSRVFEAGSRPGRLGKPLTGSTVPIRNGASRLDERCCCRPWRRPQHARIHNSRGLYQIIKRLAPKQVRKRMQLRGHDGQMLTPDQELRLLTQHFSHRFRATQPADVAMATRTWEGSGDFPLDATVLCHYIQQVPRRKAVPQGHPPSASWRLCADLISPWLCDVLHEQWSTPILQIPRAWTDVDLALVPKPDRSGRDPQDHRPIGLACPLGKKFLGALLQPHVPGIIEKIKLFPQFAYQQGRSQFAALRRVYQHCSSVRAQLQQHTRNLHQRFAGTKAVPLYGALMLTVDLAQAFDRMPRSKLYQGLCRLALPQDLIHILMAWHSSIHYNIHHHQNTSSFRASQGIRQGCSVAPLLWLVFTHEVCCALADKVGRNTLLRILTMFADDFLLADSFTSLAELEHLLNIVAVLFKTLEAFGMQVSAQKSKAILALRGTPSNSVRKRFVRPTQSGEGTELRMHTSSGVLNVPLTDSH